MAWRGSFEPSPYGEVPTEDYEDDDFLKREVRTQQVKRLSASLVSIAANNNFQIKSILLLE